MRRNEKPCVCNVFATPHSKNPVKSSVPSSPNVNFSYARDNLLFKLYRDVFKTREIRISRVFLYLKCREDYDVK